MAKPPMTTNPSPAPATDGNPPATQPTPRTRPTKNQIEDAVYTLTFAGIYFANNGGATGFVEKPYKLTCKLTHGHVNRDGAKSIFKHVIAPEFMPKKYPDFQALSTMHIVDSSCDRPELLEKNIALLTKDGLVSYIDNEELDIDASLYETDDELRQAVISYNENPDVYKASEAALQAKYGGKRKSAHDALQLNSGIDLTPDKKPEDDPDFHKQTFDGTGLMSGV